MIVITPITWRISSSRPSVRISKTIFSPSSVNSRYIITRSPGSRSQRITLPLFGKINKSAVPAYRGSFGAGKIKLRNADKYVHARRLAAGRQDEAVPASFSDMVPAFPRRFGNAGKADTIEPVHPVITFLDFNVQRRVRPRHVVDIDFD